MTRFTAIFAYSAIHARFCPDPAGGDRASRTAAGNFPSPRAQSEARQGHKRAYGRGQSPGGSGNRGAGKASAEAGTGRGQSPGGGGNRGAGKGVQADAAAGPTTMLPRGARRVAMIPSRRRAGAARAARRARKGRSRSGSLQFRRNYEGGFICILKFTGRVDFKCPGW